MTEPRRPPSESSLATARGIVARAIDEAWRDGYRMAAADAERATYSGALFEWLIATRETPDD